MSQKPLLTYTSPSTIFAPVRVGVFSPVAFEKGLAYLFLPSTFSWPEFG